MALKVNDRFTTRDGKWEVDNRPYGLSKEAFDKYSSWNIPGRGGATHIFVYAPGVTSINFYTADGRNSSWVLTNSEGWANFPMFRGSAFWGEDNGPWCVGVLGVEVARGLGLPEGYHVSTFLIVGDGEEGSQQPPETLPDDHIVVMVNGETVFDNWSDSNGL